MAVPEAEPRGRRPANEEAILRGLNAEQVRAVLAPERVALVIAAAGSGKTKVLVSRILHQIYCDGVSAGGLLALTFSRDAAREMRQRLARSVGGEVSPTGRKPATESPAEGVTVSTFHSFAYRMLRDDGAKLFDERFRMLGDGTSVEAARDEKSA